MWRKKAEGERCVKAIIWVWYMKTAEILPYLPVVNLLDFERRGGLVAKSLRRTLLLELQLAFGKGGRVDVCFLIKCHSQANAKGGKVI